jgi:hypothetical protein
MGTAGFELSPFEGRPALSAGQRAAQGSTFDKEFKRQVGAIRGLGINPGRDLGVMRAGSDAEGFQSIGMGPEALGGEPAAPLFGEGTQGWLRKLRDRLAPAEDEFEYSDYEPEGGADENGVFQRIAGKASRFDDPNMFGGANMPEMAEPLTNAQRLGPNKPKVEGEPTFKQLREGTAVDNRGMAGGGDREQLAVLKEILGELKGRSQPPASRPLIERPPGQRR